jgi:predicted permease
MFRLPVLRARDVDDDVDEEIAFHLAMREAALRARGVAPGDASRLARDRFGDVDGIRTECVREQRAQTRTESAMQMIDEARRDAIFALRALWRTKSFSLAVILTLALGIGANAMIFSIIEAVVLRPVSGVRDPAALFELGDGVSHPVFRSLAGRVTRVDLAAMRERRIALGAGDATEHTMGALVSGNFFEVVGARTVIGRSLRRDDDVAGAPPVAVLAHAYWSRAFARDPGVLGRTLSVNGAPVTIVGVADPSLRSIHLGAIPDVWLPIYSWPVIVPVSMRSLTLESAGWEWLSVVGRARPGDDLTSIGAEVGARLREIPEMRPDAVAATEVLRPMQAASLASGARGAVVRFSAILAGVVALVLLTACANIAGLLLARAAYREREIAVRIALGASRGRLVRQLLTEATVLALLGGIVGVGAFALARMAIAGITLPGGIPGSSIGLPLDGRVIGFAAIVALITGVLFGLIPALQASRPDTVSAIKGASAVRGARSQRLRGALVAAQVAVGVVLLAGTGLFTHALTRALAVDPGFRPENLVALAVDPGLAQLEGPRAAAYINDVTARVSAVRGVQRVTWARAPILTGDLDRESAQIAGYTPAPKERVSLELNVVGPHYNEVMGIPLIAGRDFTERDVAGSEPVVVINETLAKRYFAGRDPIGGVITISNVPGRVVGVVRDAKYHSLNESPRPYIWVPMLQLPPGSIGVPTLFARTTTDPAALVREITATTRSANRAVPVFDARTMTEQLRLALAPQVAGAWLLGVFSALALVVAAVGIYGVVAYAVSRRTREIGIRMALGARTPNVLRLVMGRNLAFVGIGIPIGIAAALLLARAMSDFLYGVGTADALAFGGTVVLMAVVALIASWIPAQRAVRIDPLVALRTDD